MKTYLLILILFFTTSCQIVGQGQNAYASNVDVYVTPYGSGDTIQTRRPRVGYGVAKKLRCRPRPTDRIETLKTLISRGNLSDVALTNLFGLNADEIKIVKDSKSSNKSDSTKFRNTQKPVTTEAPSKGEGWVKFGLVINNDTDFHIIVESIYYYASAVSNRCKPLVASGTIGADYCNDAVEGTTSDSSEDTSSLQNELVFPFLYFVVKKKSVRFKPLSDSAFENLTLYLGEFKYIDNSEEPSPSFKARVDARDRSVDKQNLPSEESGGVRQCDDSPRRGDPRIHFPSYLVQLTLRGYFISDGGEDIYPFSKKLQFRTESIKEGTLQ